jgi:hypothetical protein
MDQIFFLCNLFQHGKMFVSFFSRISIFLRKQISLGFFNPGIEKNIDNTSLEFKLKRFSCKKSTMTMTCDLAKHNDDINCLKQSVKNLHCFGHILMHVEKNWLFEFLKDSVHRISSSSSSCETICTLLSKSMHFCSSINVLTSWKDDLNKMLENVSSASSSKNLTHKMIKNVIIIFDTIQSPGPAMK